MGVGVGGKLNVQATVCGSHDRRQLHLGKKEMEIGFQWMCYVPLGHPDWAKSFILGLPTPLAELLLIHPLFLQCKRWGSWYPWAAGSTLQPSSRSSSGRVATSHYSGHLESSGKSCLPPHHTGMVLSATVGWGLSPHL